jgi:probable rRNA maturation factor
VKKKKIKSRISFFNNYPKEIFPGKLYQELAEMVMAAENIDIPEVNIITVDDKYLTGLHEKFLADPSDTDVLTFLVDDREITIGEIYLSIDRAKHHAKIYKVKVEEECARLVIHGLLHLKGYDDKTDDQREKMHQMENVYLRKYWTRENEIIKGQR